MTAPRLKSIAIENFRSIQGDINVSLDAPVVLIHGQNGAGKTSLLSAIELALTGAIPSLERAEPDYLQYLPHKKAKSGKGRIEIEVAGLDEKTQAAVEVTKSALTKTHFLTSPAGRFFSERCYLAQSTLTRLLELYEASDARKSESRLTGFVKELLGLDQFDAIIEGLKPVGDVRRLREPAPAFWAARQDIPDFQTDIENDGAELESLKAERKAIYDRLVARVGPILGDAATALADHAALEKRLSTSDDEATLLSLARARRDLIAILEQWRAIAVGGAGADRESIEAESAEARAALTTWNAGPGKDLDSVIEELRGWMPQLATADSAGPDRAARSALQAVEAELKRIGEVLARDDADAKAHDETVRAIEKARARLVALDEQIAEAAGANEGLAQVLSAIVPHVHGDDCPVCGRDFREESEIPLRAHLSARIGQLVEAAGRLQSLANDKSLTTAGIVTAERNLTAINARRLGTDQRDELKNKRARFEELRLSLEELQKLAAEGARLLGRVAQAARALANLRTNDQAATVLRQSVDKLADELSQPKLEPSEAVDAGASRLRVHVEEREQALGSREAGRRAALEDLGDLNRMDARVAQLEQSIRDAEAARADLIARKTEADRRIELAKELAKQTRERRTTIVRRVFNEELNTLWSDLFVRLAPEEPFVPAFALPETSSGPVEAVLETHYRAGGKGGNPRAMLSAGNLNTAALTLFLALHLSVKPRLPWLVIDDPVQSMDEVHVSQFAALLRTLSKQKDRQVIIAVHERPLFEYLALELSPAYKDDRLITVELSKAADGKTVAVWEPRTYEPDQAIAA